MRLEISGSWSLTRDIGLFILQKLCWFALCREVAIKENICLRFVFTFLKILVFVNDIVQFYISVNIASKFSASAFRLVQPLKQWRNKFSETLVRMY